jgi:hypothetical protein
LRCSVGCRPARQEPRPPKLHIALLFSVLALAALPTRAQQVPLKSYVARALQYLEAGNDPVATAYARQAVEDNPKNAYAHWLLGYLLSRAKDREGAVEEWLRASALRPEWAVPKDALRAALAEAAPRWLSLDAWERLPGEATSLEVQLGARGGAAARTASCRVYTPPGDAAGPPLADPKYGWQFPFHTYTYVRTADAPRWDRRCAVHTERTEDAALARRVAALLGQLTAMADERLGARSAGAPPETHLWLCRRGTAGGEEWRGNLYLYETARSRGASEWVREVAHEFSHVAIPGTRHYTEPEPMGNGYLGERLLPLWLADAGNGRVWDGEVSLAEYVQARTLPAAATFLNAGPRAAARSDRGRAGMEFTNGLVLTLALSHEPHAIEALLRRQIGATADNLLTGYRDWIRDLRPAAFAIAGRAFVPARSEAESAGRGATGKRLAYRVFLPAAEWSLRLEGEGVDGSRARIDGEALTRAADGTFRWRAATAGWQLLEIGADKPLTLRQVGFAVVKDGGP